MPVTHSGPDAPLPRSFCFISLAQGSTIRTLRVRTGALRAALALLAVAGLWMIGSTAYLAFHDDLVAAMMAREARMQYAYEDRIAALRKQVDREASQNLVGRSTLEGQVRDLVHRASALETRASLLADLDARLGPARARDAAAQRAPAVPAVDSRRVEALDNPVEPERTGSAGVAPSRKPRPEAALAFPEVASADPAAGDGRPLRLQLASLAEALEHVDAAQYERLASIGDQARRRVDALREALASTGLTPERIEAKAPAGSMGGPFVPLDPAVEGSPFGRALGALQGDVTAALALDRALPRLPFNKPLPGAMEVTSPFGARLDPFLGRAAMHTGVDLREDYGSAVRATAGGRVVSAGFDGGYGLMVEIDHGHGLATRYAHLSAVDVEVGQVVGKGDGVGRVGATGRATGPHLHYETRIDGEPVDPMRFLLAGQRLAALDIQP